MIRPLDPEGDLDYVTEVESTYFECDWTQEDHRKQFQVPGCAGLILESDGRPVALLIHQPAEPEGGTYIRTLAVDSECRRCGHARRLMNHMIAQGKPLFLHVWTRNKAAQALYRSLGFIVVRREEGFYGDGDGNDAYLMLRP